MLRWLALISLAGCGRIGFEVASQRDGDGSTDGAGDGVLSGHDEDGDGVPDSIDLCPHVMDTQADTDGDGVGNGCDPDPTMPNHIAMFATMQPGDMPFDIVPFGAAGWTQGADGMLLDGDLGGDFYGGLTLPISAGNVRVDVGIDITAVGSVGSQHQFSVSTTDVAPYYFGEINEVIGSYSNAQITLFDGANYFRQDSQVLPSGVHAGAVQFILDEHVNTSVTVLLAWPGEPHMAMMSDNTYQASDFLRINVNNLQLQIRYVCVITSP